MTDFSKVQALVDRFYSPSDDPEGDAALVSVSEMISIFSIPEGLDPSEHTKHFSNAEAVYKSRIHKRKSDQRNALIFDLHHACVRAVNYPEVALPRNPTANQVKDFRRAKKSVASIRRDLENLPTNIRDTANMFGVAFPVSDRTPSAFTTEELLSDLETHFDFVARWAEKRFEKNLFPDAKAKRSAILIAQAAVKLQLHIAPELAITSNHGANPSRIQEFTASLFELFGIDASATDIIRNHCKDTLVIVNGEIGFA